MSIAVVGLWHLGTVTAACVAAAGFEVVGIDEKDDTVTKLRAGVLPEFEPGLAELAGREVAAGRLRFSADLSDVA
jgi:UDPglucose 6-dehydrogenase